MDLTHERSSVPRYLSGHHADVLSKRNLSRPKMSKAKALVQRSSNLTNSTNRTWRGHDDAKEVCDGRCCSSASSRGEAMVDADDNATANLKQGSSRGTPVNGMMHVGQRSLTGPGEVAGSRGYDVAGLRLSTTPVACVDGRGGKDEV
ncbi:hypothetical protein CFC21_082072 [Triticum aestivum]|uniref:DUF4005 domain-containing protein n=3 Tax=Triticum TaxID=4564 RepID=A0A9R1I5S1_WHEAT|nr:hypothetical protein CFC21_082071 [Triticum aestivum]KAF7077533.1 hypothetical protein CFC21_082072 [Triticum aestivum]VAI42581.1 unnamed protein product [Triticum turgidum subsp. durum]